MCVLRQSRARPQAHPAHTIKLHQLLIVLLLLLRFRVLVIHVDIGVRASIVRVSALVVGFDRIADEVSESAAIESAGG